MMLAGCGKPAPSPAPTALTPLKVARDERPLPQPLKKDDREPSIKLKRGKDGSYTWEINGKDVETVLKADRALQRSLGSRISGKGGSEE